MGLLSIQTPLKKGHCQFLVKFRQNILVEIAYQTKDEDIPEI